MKRADRFLDNFDRTLEIRFREQAEMLDVRFAAVYDRFARVDERFARLDDGFTRIDRELAVIRKDLAVVREGVGMLLKKLA